MTLEELKVVSRDQVKVDGRMVEVEFTPTTPACGMANVIGQLQKFFGCYKKSDALLRCPSGLAIMVRLIRSLPPRYKVRISMTPGSHQHVAQGTHAGLFPHAELTERSSVPVTKQLNDKERVAAAMEVEAIMDSINSCLATAGQRGRRD